MIFDILLYLTIIFSATLFAFLSQRIISYKEGNGTVVRRGKKYFKPYFFSFLILTFFACFTANGIDKDAYRFLFKENTIGYIYEGVEPGFWFLIIITKLFTNNEDFFLSLISFLTVFFVYKGIWKCYDKLSIGLAIFIFASQYYLQSFNLMRMYLSMSILVLGARNIIDGKQKIYFIYILIASSIHFSALFVLVGFLISFLLTQRGRMTNKLFFILSIITIIVVSSFAVGVAAQFAELDFSGKYSAYLSETSTGTVGLKTILNIFPYILVLYLCKRYTDNRWLISLSEGFCLVVLSISIIGYSVPVFSRALNQFSVYIIILLPTCLYMYKCGKLDNIKWKNKIKKHYLISFILFFYFFLLLFLYLRDYMELDGLDDFKFIWQ